jgi:phage repressor protein C with HTH and peptisase S24 domain
MSDERSGPSGLARVVARHSMVRVRGASMQPTLNDGDVLLVRVVADPPAGSLVLVRLPGHDGLSVKRLVRREPEGWWVERDNPRQGVDSWSVGAVAPDDMVAQVVARIWPLRRIRSSPTL